VAQSHLVTGDRLGALLQDAVRPVASEAHALLADLGQRNLTPIGPQSGPSVAVDGTLAGRAYQLSEIIERVEGDRRTLWVPMLDGAERAGVLRLVMDVEDTDDSDLRGHCWTLSGLMGYIIMSKLVHSDHLRRLRAPVPLSVAAEMLWQLVPPRTFGDDRVVVSAILEPYDRVAGDAYDYAVDSHAAQLAVFDGVGHDLDAGTTTALAIGVIRNARRRGEAHLVRHAEHADRHIVARGGPLRFVTAVLATLHTHTGVLDYVLAGHPPPLLLRDGHMIRQLGGRPDRPLGVTVGPARRSETHHEQLEPGDRVLFYSDGITEARDACGRFFGEDRLVDLTERTELSRLPAPETLRRLAAAVLEHQHGELQDDATLLMLDWSADSHHRLLPSDLPIPTIPADPRTQP
jgi:serine phosphatase RsbU (regulator of sigma subunit)